MTGSDVYGFFLSLIGFLVSSSVRNKRIKSAPPHCTVSVARVSRLFHKMCYDWNKFNIHNETKTKCSAGDTEF